MEEDVKNLLAWLDREFRHTETLPTYDDPSYYRNEGAAYTLDNVRDKVRNIGLGQWQAVDTGCLDMVRAWYVSRQRAICDPQRTGLNTREYHTNKAGAIVMYTAEGAWRKANELQHGPHWQEMMTT